MKIVIPIYFLICLIFWFSVSPNPLFKPGELLERQYVITAFVTIMSFVVLIPVVMLVNLVKKGIKRSELFNDMATKLDLTYVETPQSDIFFERYIFNRYFSYTLRSDRCTYPRHCGGQESRTCHAGRN